MKKYRKNSEKTGLRSKKKIWNTATFLMLISMCMFCFISVPSTVKAQLTGRQIIRKVQDRPDGDNRKSVMTMTLVNKRGSKRIRTLLSYSIDVEKDSKSIMFFQAPADVKGTGFLVWDYDNPAKDDDRWLYMPAMKKTRRISGTSAKKEYFMGTDFTYDDMGGRNIDEDSHKLLREENVEGYNCWIVESVPKGSGESYSKTVSWIRQDALAAVKVEYYDRMGSLLKTLEVSDIRKVNGLWTAHNMHMTNHQTNHQTIISMSSLDYDIDIPDNLFTVSTLEKGKIN